MMLDDVKSFLLPISVLHALLLQHRPLLRPVKINTTCKWYISFKGVGTEVLEHIKQVMNEDKEEAVNNAVSMEKYLQKSS